MKIFKYIKNFFKDFVEYPFNPSKNAKRFINKNAANIKTKIKIKKKIQNIKKIESSKTQLKLITPKSVFIKFSVLFSIFIISSFIGCYLIKTEQKFDIYSKIINHVLCDWLKFSYEENLKRGIAVFSIYPLGFIFMLIFSIPFYIGLYCYYPIFKFALSAFFFVFGISYGLLHGLAYCFIKQEYKLYLHYFVLFEFVIVFITLLIMIFLSFLYYSRKIKINEKYRNLIIILYMISFVLGLLLIFSAYALPITNLMYGFYLISAVFHLIFGSLICVLALQDIDTFIQEKIPKKYEWLLVYLLFLSFLQILLGLFYGLVYLNGYLYEIFLKKNKK
ncbi:MAG: Bax inhibitor-1/YccA family protein [Phytoplasma sp.]|uniref:Bax inhibitor-1/YccA family membrane protein n=1 Tax=Phytoplasma sp. TaxID=2155 RepID=UPI002B40BAA4|nr:Bax inhibitor-1/YccA family protein [Phytoplasma sp.]WRH06587.1 MAG: Bax inhibitor-1/YccA family protein [Phytoplasma sp.]